LFGHFIFPEYLVSFYFNELISDSASPEFITTTEDAGTEMPTAIPNFCLLSTS
jgi:hypothetical protein